MSTPIAHTEAVKGYAPSFVHPDVWPVTLDGCRTDPPGDGDALSFSWSISRDGEVDPQDPRRPLRGEPAVAG